MAVEVKSAIRSQVGWDNMDPAEQAQYNAHYLTLAAWQSGEVRDLVSADEIAIAEIFDDWPGSGVIGTYPTVEFTGWTTDATRYIVVRGAPGNEWDITARTGARIIQQSGDTYAFIIRAGHWLKFYDLGIETPYTNISGTFFTHNSQTVPTEFHRCHFFNCSNLVVSGNQPYNYAYNCLFEIYGLTAGGGPSPRDWTGIENCTVIQKAGTGSYNGEIAIHDSNVNNVLAFNENTFVSLETFRRCNSTGGHNAQNDNGGGPPPGANPYLTVVEADFRDFAGGDYHLSDGSALIGLGFNNLSVAGPKDIDREDWPGAGNWDIGCDYWVDSGVVEPKSNPLLFGQDF